MDPHPTPFAGKRRSVAAPAKMVVPKPKPITAVRRNPAKKSPTGNAGAAPQPRLRRAFGTIRSSNSVTEKPLHQKKTLKLSGSPLEKPSKVSPPPLQKPAKVSSPPPPLQKPSKQSPPNPIRAARPSRPAAKPLKKTCPGPDLEAKAKKRSQRVSFQEGAAAAAAPGSEQKAKASPADAARHTPMVSVKTFDKKLVKVVAAETPFFSAQNCSSCTLDQLESASYWLAQIRLAESVGKHKVAATFFGLAFECEAQPFHRIQSELRNYVARHESASTLTSSFDELLHSHGMPMNQPKFDPDGFEIVDTQLTSGVVDKMLDPTTQVAECSECDCGGSLVDVGEANTVREGEKGMDDQPSFDEKKLDGSFEFDDCEAIIVDQVVEAHADLEKNVNMDVPCDTEIIQPACSSTTDKLSLKGSSHVRGSSIDESHFATLSPSALSSSAKRLSSVSPFGKKSQFGSRSSKRLTSSCPSHKKSSTKGLSLKRMSSGGCSDVEHNATAGAVDSGNMIQGQFDCHASVDQVEFKEDGEFAAVNEANNMDILELKLHSLHIR